MALQTFDAVAFRQRLAGLIDPQQELDPKLKEWQKTNAIRFVATLPAVFGESLDRTTLWDRIASGVEAAVAKTADSDAEFFVSEVLRHILANRGKVAASLRLSQVLTTLAESIAEERQAFIDYIASHLDAVLIFARAEWRRYVEDKKAGRDVAWWGESPEFEEACDE